MKSGALGSPRSDCYNPALGEERRPPGLHMRQKSSILIARAAALSLLVACSAHVAPAPAQSSTDKRRGLCGGSDSKPQEQQAPQGDPDEPRAAADCPQVTIRAGASTYAVAASGKQAVGHD